MSVVYVLTTPILENGGDDATMEQIRKRNKWDNDDYVCRELWNSLEAKYMSEDASSKKFLVSNFTNYKMTDSRPVLEQYNELLRILGRLTQHKINMNEAIQVSCIIVKLLSSWKDFKHTLKHKKEELTLVELGIHLRNEESLKVQDNDKPKGSNVAGPYLLVLSKKSRPVLHNKKVKPKPETTLGIGVVGQLKLFIEPNDSVSKNSIIELRDVTKEVVQQPEPELRKSKRNKTPKDFGPEFQLYLIEVTRDKVSKQHSYCFNIEDDPKTFDEAIKSQDVAFWKEAINDEMDSIMGNNTWLLADLPPGFEQKSGIDYFDTYAPVSRISTVRLLIVMASIHNLIIHQMDVETAFLNGDLDEEYSRVIGCLMYVMTCTSRDIAFVVGKLSRLTYTCYPSVLKGYTDASWISNTEDNALQSGWSVATLAKAYSQMHNRKSRHLGVRHNMIRELITNGMISIEFVRDVKKSTKSLNAMTSPNSLLNEELRKLSLMCKAEHSDD
ncbi:zinc finger, CCHC-type containing protein [Tanacetum coccineum]|uniref:Zinc finger, CCHC-type containing protein n=1 Tax=Tanacetum coccineum TaxID=301880 RepID=A0ABQ5I2K4_9ASTR